MPVNSAIFYSHLVPLSSLQPHPYWIRQSDKHRGLRCMTAPHHLGRYLDDVDRSHWPDLASVVMFLRYRDSCLSVSAYGVTGQRWCTSHGTPKKVVIPPAHELPLLTSLHDAGASMKCLGWELRFLLVSCSPRLTAPASSLAHNNRTSRSRSSGGREQTRRAGRLWP